MRNTKKLWKPLSNIVGRRTLPSTCPFNYYSKSNSNALQAHFLTSTSCHLLNHHPRQLSETLTFSTVSAQKLNNRICWNCSTAAPESAPFLYCHSCRSVQPVDHSAGFFQIYGLDKNYEIEDKNLEGKYKDWQKKLHPDLVHSKSQEEREYAAEQSARVIEAYRTLTDPLSRAIYIMKLEGKDVNEEETVSDPELLTEIMEVREAVEDAADSKALNAVLSPVQEKLAHWSKSFANAFRNRKFDEALTCIRRMTYYDRIQKEITKKL